MFDRLPHSSGILEVAGCTIRYRRYGRPDRPCLVLVHGGRAHSGWWFGVVPELAPHFDLWLPELSGFGDSGHRDSYSATGWAAEVAALIEHSGRGSAVVAGHSLGGRVAIVAAAGWPHLVERLVLIDAPVWTSVIGAAREPRRIRRHYPSREEALARFRLDPPPTIADPALLREVGHHAVTRDELGWTWKFDPAARRRVADREIEEALGRVRCPVGVIYGERSTVVDKSSVDRIADRLGRPVPAVEIPGAYHHVPLDAPQACAEAIRRLAEASNP